MQVVEKAICNMLILIPILIADIHVNIHILIAFWATCNENEDVDSKTGNRTQSVTSMISLEGGHQLSVTLMTSLGAANQPSVTSMASFEVVHQLSVTLMTFLGVGHIEINEINEMNEINEIYGIY